MNKSGTKSKDLVRLAKDFNNLDQIVEVVPILKKMPIVDISEVLCLIDNKHLIQILNEFSLQQQASIFSEFTLTKQLSYFQQISKKKFAILFENMPSDARADLFQIMTQQEQVDLIPFLSKKIRENVLTLSFYPSDTAGGIMNTDFATVKKNMTCEEAIKKVREDAPSKKTIYYVYVVNEDQSLQGFITLKDLIIAEPDALVENELHDQFVFGYVDEDSESIARKIDKYELVAIPILNQKKQLMGIVTHDDAIDIIRAEHTEDMERFMGILSTNDDTDYNATSIFTHFKKRIFWLVILATVGIISGLIIHSYQGALAQMMILALYMPMIADTGGNSGSQAATVVIRSLSLGEITIRDWFRVIWKETRIALLLSICLGILAFGKVVFLSWETEIPTNVSLINIGMIIAIALSLQVVTSTIIGAALPLIVRRFGGDPAVAASPAITTIVDITGLSIYFSLASIFFNL